MKKFVAMALAALIFALPMGCTTTGSSSDAQRTRNEGTAVGAGTGAVLGGIIGALVGGDSKGALIGAAIGAAAGGAAGYAYGDHVASQKAAYAKEEDWLDQCIVSAQKVNQETKAYNDNLRVEIAELDAKTQALKAQYEAKKADKAALLAEKKTIDEAMAAAKGKLDRARFERDSQKQALAQVKGSESRGQALDAEIKKLEGLIGELEQHSENLAGLSSRMAV